MLPLDTQSGLYAPPFILLNHLLQCCLRNSMSLKKVLFPGCGEGPIPVQQWALDQSNFTKPASYPAPHLPGIGEEHQVALEPVSSECHQECAQNVHRNGREPSFGLSEQLPRGRGEESCIRRATKAYLGAAWEHSRFSAGDWRCGIYCTADDSSSRSSHFNIAEVFLLFVAILTSWREKFPASLGMFRTINITCLSLFDRVLVSNSCCCGARGYMVFNCALSNGVSSNQGFIFYIARMWRSEIQRMGWWMINCSFCIILWLPCA